MTSTHAAAARTTTRSTTAVAAAGRRGAVARRTAPSCARREAETSGGRSSGSRCRRPRSVGTRRATVEDAGDAAHLMTGVPGERDPTAGRRGHAVARDGAAAGRRSTRYGPHPTAAGASRPGRGRRSGSCRAGPTTPGGLAASVRRARRGRARAGSRASCSATSAPHNLLWTGDRVTRRGRLGRDLHRPRRWLDVAHGRVQPSRCAHGIEAARRFAAAYVAGDRTACRSPTGDVDRRGGLPAADRAAARCGLAAAARRRMEAAPRRGCSRGLG